MHIADADFFYMSDRDRMSILQMNVLRENDDGWIDLQMNFERF